MHTAPAPFNAMLNRIPIERVRSMGNHMTEWCPCSQKLRQRLGSCANSQKPRQPPGITRTAHLLYNLSQKFRTVLFFFPFSSSKLSQSPKQTLIPQHLESTNHRTHFIYSHIHNNCGAYLYYSRSSSFHIKLSASLHYSSHFINTYPHRRITES